MGQLLRADHALARIQDEVWLSVIFDLYSPQCQTDSISVFYIEDVRFQQAEFITSIVQFWLTVMIFLMMILPYKCVPQ